MATPSSKYKLLPFEVRYAKKVSKYLQMCVGMAICEQELTNLFFLLAGFLFVVDVVVVFVYCHCCWFCQSSSLIVVVVVGCRWFVVVFIFLHDGVSVFCCLNCLFSPILIFIFVFVMCRDNVVVAGCAWL